SIIGRSTAGFWVLKWTSLATSTPSRLFQHRRRPSLRQRGYLHAPQQSRRRRTDEEAFYPMPTILVVEDTAELSEVICRELEAAGYGVSATADGSSALSLNERQPFDLIILDWMIPGIDGLETLRRLRQRQATPVLMLTARAEEADRVLGLEIGADDYLT